MVLFYIDKWLILMGLDLWFFFFGLFFAIDDDLFLLDDNTFRVCNLLQLLFFVATADRLWDFVISLDD